MRVARVERPGGLARALRELGFDRSLPVLVVVGGADGLADTDREGLEPLIDNLAALAERRGAVVIDGGTDVGVMQLLGRARARGLSFPLLGIVVAELAVEPPATAAEGQAMLEPNHSHVLLVPGRDWGDEAPWLARAAGIVAGERPSVTILVNGGEIAYADAAASVAEGRQVLVVAGSGRSADSIAAAFRGEPAGEHARVLAASDLVKAIDLRDDAELLIVEQLFAAGSSRLDAGGREADLR
jgi:hypothetical protein